MCRSLDKEKMLNINKELSTVDWSQLNDTNVNIALGEFQQTIEDCLDTLEPLKLKKKPSHKIWHEQWIIKGISKSMDKVVNLYKQSIKIDSTPDKEKNI